MKLEGNYTFPAPQSEVWRALQDPIILAQVMPGCEKLDKVGENSYAGAMKIRVGPMQGVFHGQVTLTNLQEPRSFDMVVHGNGGALGAIEATGSIILTATSDSETEMVYVGEPQVNGRLASVGQRLIERSAKALVQQSLVNLEQQITARQNPATAESAPPPAAPSQTQFALGVAKNMFDDMVTPEAQPQLLKKVGVALLIFWLVRRLEKRIANRVSKRVIREIRRHAKHEAAK